MRYACRSVIKIKMYRNQVEVPTKKRRYKIFHEYEYKSEDHNRALKVFYLKINSTAGVAAKTVRRCVGR